jgi:streptomycin 3"-adenylyltransferase
MGCFNPEISDIDFLVVVRDKLDIKTKKEIIDSVIEISDSMSLPKKELEFSIILQKDLENFSHPMPFELHYSKDWKEKYRLGEIDYTKENRDPDLAAHITVTLNRGICLYGRPIKEIFKPIPEKDYIDSLLYDVESISENINKDPIYGILNLCRVLYYLEERTVSSKEEGGVWGLKNLPEKFRGLIEKTLLSYRGALEDTDWDNEKLLEFVSYMLGEIEKAI